MTIYNKQKTFFIKTFYFESTSCILQSLRIITDISRSFVYSHAAAANAKLTRNPQNPHTSNARTYILLRSFLRWQCKPLSIYLICFYKYKLSLFLRKQVIHYGAKKIITPSFFYVALIILYKCVVLSAFQINPFALIFFTIYSVLIVVLYIYLFQ